MTSPFLSFPCWLTLCPFGLSLFFFFSLVVIHWKKIHLASEQEFMTYLQVNFTLLFIGQSQPLKYPPDCILETVSSSQWCRRTPLQPVCAYLTWPAMSYMLFTVCLPRIYSLKRTYILECGLRVFWKVSRRYCIAGGIKRNNGIWGSTLCFLG